MQLVDDSVFGTIWGSVIKAHVKTGVLPADALNQGTCLEELSNINAHRTLEQIELAGMTEQAQPNEDSAPTVHDLTLATTDSTRAAVRPDVKFAILTIGRRDTLQTMLVRTRKNIAARINLIARDTSNGVTMPARNKYVWAWQMRSLCAVVKTEAPAGKGV